MKLKKTHIFNGTLNKMGVLFTVLGVVGLSDVASDSLREKTFTSAAQLQLSHF